MTVYPVRFTVTQGPAQLSKVKVDDAQLNRNSLLGKAGLIWSLFFYFLLIWTPISFWTTLINWRMGRRNQKHTQVLLGSWEPSSLMSTHETAQQPANKVKIVLKGKSKTQPTRKRVTRIRLNALDSEHQRDSPVQLESYIIKMAGSPPHHPWIHYRMYTQSRIFTFKSPQPVSVLLCNRECGESRFYFSLVAMYD